MLAYMAYMDPMGIEIAPTINHNTTTRKPALAVRSCVARPGSAASPSSEGLQFPWEMIPYM